MPPGRRLSTIPATSNSENVEDTVDTPKRRGKAASLAAKNQKKMNKQKARVEFKKGLLKPIGPWAKEFGYEVGRTVRMHAPLACRRWKKVPLEEKKELAQRLLEYYEVDLHLLHVRRAVYRFLGQRLKNFRWKLHKHYLKIADGLDKKLHPHEDVHQADWAGMCDWFETDEFLRLSEKNTASKKVQKDGHSCGSKPFVRIREEMKDQETGEVPGKITMYHRTRYNGKKGHWVSAEAEENYAMMTELQSAPTASDSTPITEDQVYDQVLGVRPGYVRGLGHGQDPLPTALGELEDVDEAHRISWEAEKRAEEAERRAQEAQQRFEESERRLQESERRTDEKIQGIQAMMVNFMAQFQNDASMGHVQGGPSLMSLLMGGGMGGN